MEEGRTVLLGTPKDWWELLDGEFNFQLDAAADDRHTMCERYWTEEQDALRQDWDGRVWCSPPWGEPELEQWVRKGYRESNRGSLVVMLLPVRPAASWWHDFVMKADEVRFIKGALEFVPFEVVALPIRVEPHCLVIWRGYATIKSGPVMASYPSRVPGE